MASRRPHHHPARRMLAALLLACPALAVAQAAPPPAAPLAISARDSLALRRTAVRTPTALVLSGGGSRGLAHVGVLREVERLGYDPAVVVGTSMGALVGALYAAGYSPDVIEQRVRAVEWGRVFTPAPLVVGPGREARYPLLSFDRDVDSLRFNRGFIPQWRINRALVQLLFDAGARSRGDFDRLARRYRAIGADLKTGDTVLLARGDLARAARASMAVPGLFAPVQWEGSLLVDGGIANNLPVSVARDLGAAGVIAADVGRPPAEIEGRGPLQVVGRALDLLQERAHRDTLPADALLLPAIPPDFNGISFPADPGSLFRLGEAAARRGLAPATTTRGGARPLPPAPDRFGALRIEAPDSATVRLARAVFARVAPGPYDPGRVLAAVDRLYATGLFEGIWPTVADGADSTAPALLVRLEAQPRQTVSGAVGYDTDRSGRFWAALQHHRALGAAPAALAAAISADRVAQWASLSAQLHPVRMAPLAAAVGVAASRAELRSYGGAGRGDDVTVSRHGAWVGVETQQRRYRWLASLALRAEQVAEEGGVRGWAVGPALRVASPQPGRRVVGVPGLLQAEARWGGRGYRRLELRGAQEFPLPRLPALRAAVVADLAATSREAPLDARPALGDRYGMPGLRWGEERGRFQALGGVDLAYPLAVGGHLRTRLRLGAAADEMDEITDGERWIAGAEAGFLLATPLGALSASAGLNSRQDLRLVLDFGADF